MVDKSLVLSRYTLWILTALALVALPLAGCGLPTPSQTPPSSTPAPTPTPTPTPAPLPTPAEPTLPRAPTTSPTSTQPTDTTPPSAITNPVASDAYDGRVNLSWVKSTVEDFGHYNIYVSKSEIIDVTGMTLTHQIKDIATNTYQVTELEPGIKYYFAVTAVDKSGNENALVTCVSTIPTLMPRGTVDPDIYVDIYHSNKAWSGTTLLPDNHNPEKPRIIEVNMLGEIIWQYLVPQDLRQYTNPGFDVELLPDNNILLVLPGYGVCEISRGGNTVWSYLDPKVSHDADRLPNGNTLVVFGNNDQKGDAQVKEVNPKGEIVWAWYAKDHFLKAPYKDIYDDGWTHTNAISRLPNGKTVISLRNFNFVVEVDPKGTVVRTIGEGIFRKQHDPEILPDGNLLVANHREPHRAVEVDPEMGKIVWQSAGFERDTIPVRDANRLPNGNTLITGTTKIVEVTAEGKIVWQLRLKTIIEKEQSSRLGFYKAERINVPDK